MNNDWKVKAVVGEEIYNSVITELNKLTDDDIKEMMSRGVVHYYITKDKEYLLSVSSELWRKEYGELEAISYLDVYLTYGIDVMEEADEKGVAKIRRE